MIRNVLEIRETQVREVMTPLVDVVAIDATASLLDFQTLWLYMDFLHFSFFHCINYIMVCS